VNLKALQREASDWSKRNFGPHHGTGYRNLLGLMEEVGELSHAHLKHEQGIRTNEDHHAKKVDAVADILIFLVNYCDSQGIDLDDAVEKTWAEVSQRDWTKNRQTGGCGCGR
jgi:NTP pyrophosphatase (non-canonical NTP hydrolase)